MRKCPKCGYVDPPDWRVLRWNTDVDYCHIDNFRSLESNLAQRLLSGEEAVIDSTFAYTLMGKGKVHVHRIVRERYEKYGLKAFHTTPMEHVKGHTGSKRSIRRHIKRMPDYKVKQQKLCG